MPDTKLQKLVAELGERIKKSDVAGIVLLSSPKNMEWGIQVEATWTCFKLEELCSATWALMNLLNASIGTNADWPIRVNTDNQKDADTLCYYMNLVERCLKNLGMPVKKDGLSPVAVAFNKALDGPTPDPFEEWWLSEGINQCHGYKHMTKVGWDAAIEWAKEQWVNVKPAKEGK